MGNVVLWIPNNNIFWFFENLIDIHKIYFKIAYLKLKIYNK